MVGRIEAVNQYLDTLPIKTNDEDINLMRIKSGVENLTMISAKDIPGVLLQVSIYICNTIFNALSTTILIKNCCRIAQGSLALGDYYDADRGLPQKKTILIQRTIGLFFAVLRAMSFEETNEEKVQVF